MTPTNEEVRLRLYAAYWDMSVENATKSIEMWPALAPADSLLAAFLALERERTAGLVEAEREACAEEAEAMYNDPNCNPFLRNAGVCIAAAIRARGGVK